MPVVNENKSIGISKSFSIEDNKSLLLKGKMKEKYKLVLSYDGTDYCGWQRQPDKKTIQGMLEEALAKIIGQKVAVIGAGRTDAGVHALAQAAHFQASTHLQEKELWRAFNAILPGDIRVIELEKVDKDFHARRLAKSKIYQYRIINSPLITPFLFRYAFHWPAPLDWQSMAEAAPLFVREADFSGFSSNRFLRPIRKVTASIINKKESEIIYTIEANGFLRYMVRTIVGTLLEIGKGKMSPLEIDKIFHTKSRSLAGPTAPAKGLCLIKVNY